MPDVEDEPSSVPAGSPYALVWRHLRRTPIERRNELAVVETVVEPDSSGLSVPLPCGGGWHRASVGPGGLVLHDHDVAAELAMVSLGGAVPGCLVYGAVWEEGLVGDRFLRAWADDVEGERLQAAREDWLGNYWEYWPTDPAAGRVLFGPSLQRALAMASLREVVIEADAGPASRWATLVRAARLRARRAFVESLGSVASAHRRPDALVPVRISVGVSAPPSVGGRLSQDGSSVALVLGADWVSTVWGPGLAVVDGRFVLCRRDDVAFTVAWRPTGRRASEHAPVIEARPLG